jgi:hypothetical protein
MGVESIEKPGADKNDMVSNISTRRSTIIDTKGNDQI